MHSAAAAASLLVINSLNSATTSRKFLSRLHDQIATIFSAIAPLPKTKAVSYEIFAISPTPIGNLWEQNTLPPLSRLL